MGLDDLREEISKEESRQKSILILEEKKRQEWIKNEERKVNLSLEKDLPKLKLIEDDFWRFAKKFSDIIIKIPHRCTERKTLLGIFVLSSIETKDYYKKNQYPVLHVNYTIDADNYFYVSIRLKAKEGILYFYASSGKRDSSFAYRSSNGKLYSSHQSQFELENFNKIAAVKWLEDQFVIYYRKTQSKETK